VRQFKMLNEDFHIFSFIISKKEKFIG